MIPQPVISECALVLDFALGFESLFKFVSFLNFEMLLRSLENSPRILCSCFGIPGVRFEVEANLWNSEANPQQSFKIQAKPEIKASSYIISHEIISSSPIYKS